MYEDKILSIYEECHVERFPIDCFKITTGLGFSVTPFSELMLLNPDLSFLKNTATDALTVTNKKAIYYNDGKPRKRVRFTLMHELGHIVANTTNEELADRFAAEILAPLCIVRRSNLRTADEICARFDVSVACANKILISSKNELSSVYDRKLLRYFDDIKARTSLPKRSITINDKYRKYEERDQILRERYTSDEYWSIVLDKVEQEWL